MDPVEIIIVPENVLQLTRFLGGFLTILGFTIAFNSDRAVKLAKDSTATSSFAFIEPATFMPALVGSWLLSNFSAWTNDWTCLITVLGWAMVLGAIFRGWFTESWLNTMKKVKKPAIQAAGSVAGLIGLFLLYKGWWM